MASVLGIDIAKQKIEASLILTDKFKGKSFNNSLEGFETLEPCLEKWGIERVYACLEATGNYGEDLATFQFRSETRFISRYPEPPGNLA